MEKSALALGRSRSLFFGASTLSPTPHEFDDDVAIDPQLRLAEAGSLRRWLFNWLFNSEIEGNYYQFIERWIALLIIANLFALVF